MLNVNALRPSIIPLRINELWTKVKDDTITKVKSS
jgi:hypothetical protein